MNGYLTKAELTKLDAILKTVPWLAHRLDETILRQDRIGGAPIPSLGGNDSTEQPLPYNAHASAVRDQLRNALVTWARHMLEQRAMTYTGDDTTAGISRWLRTNIDALALTEGSAEALPDIDAAVRPVWRVIDRPDERIRAVTERDMEEARRALLTTRGIAALARELGADFARLTQDRVESLHRAGHIAPVCAPNAFGHLYLVGDVLDAHQRVKTRRREKVAA
ncbi:MULTISPECIES: hypothetical protein [Rhodococcus]|uniref:hypothetical protein n=1 Tax=Rhodococcus TaxID=1827 RepID=UPI001E430542|nr:hypothetical protein [Rhodococcus pyridinivorans]MCD2116786.1 hypothetical protein [Rhodococcus pyridinivorans]MCZ4626006.1 hypothetical protein [Rhodococcus pyridinivorans]MCZ4646961.1 hypothetical protein [Rhodococcus pyridinivorans]MDJ0480313.1 hypothetical protein [Rhodococcus pyridinivorans]MDV7253064.1 hypothetical protein [Rhodococcus pyridinivorans]